MTTLLYVVNGNKYTVTIEKHDYGLYAYINNGNKTIVELSGDKYSDIHTTTKRILKGL